MNLELRFLSTGVVRARVTEKVPLYGKGRWEAHDLLLPEAQAPENGLTPRILASHDAGYPIDIATGGGGGGGSSGTTAVTVLSAKEGVAVAVYLSPFSLVTPNP